MGKRRHQSSSVEEVSPAVIRRTSSRLTRSKKLKATTKSASPVLGKVVVNKRQDGAMAAGPSSRARVTPGQSTRHRISDVQRLLELDCQTPRRQRHSRSSNVQFTSPHSESEPEIIWDDKSPNALQPRKLGKAGKRNAVEDISDIINCVPDVIIDNGNKKPSLLSLWMTRDSPSPKPELKSSQESNRPEKKKGVGKKKARKSRLSALTHELEKVLSAIEPEEEDVEEEEEETTPGEKPHCSKATTAGSSTATLVEAEGSPPTLNTQPSTLKPPSVQGRSSPPTLYTQTKPTQTTALPKPIPLPALGHSPDIKSKDPAVVQTLKEEKAVKQIEDKVTSDDSPPCSQTKWEAIGNESAEDLWGDDEFFEDDGILMDTIEVEIASSQVASSTPVRRVNKRLSLKGRTGTGVKKTGVLKPAENVQIAVSVAKTVISNASRLLTNSVPLDSAKKFVRATSANTIPNQTGSSYAGNTVTCSYQVVAKSETQTSAQISQSQKAFVPHKANCKSGFQPYKQSTSSVGNVNSQTTCVSQTTTVATYSLRSSNKMPHTTSRPQGVGSHLNVPKSASVTTGASQHVLNCPTSRQSTEVSRNCNTSSTSSSSGVTSVTSVASVTRTSPPSVTRVVYSTSTTSAITNPSRIIATARSQSSTFVPFKPGTQATQSIAPVTSQTSAAQSKPGNSVSTTSQNIGHGKASAATTNNPSASKIYVPYQKRDAQKKQSIPQKKVPPQSTREHKDSPSQQSKVYVPYRKQTCQDTTTVKPVPAGKTCKPPTSMTKVYVPYKKANQAQPSTTQTQCGKPSESGVVSSSQSLSKSSAFGKSTAQAVPSDSSNHPNVSSVNTTATLSSTQSQYNPAKQGANQTSTSSQISDSKSRSFVPFKKPGSTQSNQYKPAISSSSSQYKPSIPSSSSQYKPSIPNSSSQYKPTSPCSQNMNKSVVFGGTNSTVSRSQTGCTTKSSTVTAVTKSSTFVRHTGTALHISQPTSTSCSAQSLSRSTTSVPATKPHTFVRANTAQTSMPMKLHLSTSSATNKAQDSSMQNKASLNLAANRSNSTTANVQLCASKNLAASHCSNNNVDLSKIFSPSKESSKSTASFSSVGATVTKSNPAVGSQMKSVGAGPDLKSTSVGEGGQFDDSLPDEMLMSVMDGSWDDEF